MAKAAQEITDFVNGQVAIAKQLEKKKKGEEDVKFKIGS